MRLVALLSVLALVLLIVGCGEDEPTGPGTVAAPTNLTIEVAGSDSLSVRLSWSASSGTVDGYIISFAGNVIDTTTDLFYQDTPTALGTYSVKAYQGTSSSSAVEISTALHEEAGEGPVYYLPSSNPSGYGWDNVGNGTVYSAVNANRDLIDFVVDIFDDLRSPSDTFGSLWHTTGIAHDVAWTYSGMTVAPLSGYLTAQTPMTGGVYVLWLSAVNRYVKLEITEYNSGSHYITFRFGFQAIAGFRRLG
jgi:hypothetical protein